MLLFSVTRLSDLFFIVDVLFTTHEILVPIARASSEGSGEGGQRTSQSRVRVVIFFSKGERFVY